MNIMFLCGGDNIDGVQLLTILWLYTT